MPPKRACDVCFKRKIQCIKPNPDDPCEWCSHHDFECTVKRETQKKSNDISAVLSHVQVLTRRVTELESTLQQIRSENGPSVGAASYSGDSLTSKSPESGLSTDAAQTASSFHISPQANLYATQLNYPASLCKFLGQHWYFKGIPIFSDRGREWMLSRSGEKPSLKGFRLFGSQPSVLASTQSSQQCVELPERQRVEMVLNSYLRSPWRLTYPVLDPVLIQETLALAYTESETTAPSHRQVLAQTCILAILAMTSRLKGLQDLPFFLTGDICANALQNCLPHVVTESTLETLQAVLMLIYRTLTGQWETAAILHSFTCRMIYDLKGHCFHPTMFDHSSNLYDQRRREHTRNLFWLCYIFDKDISIRYGRPPCITRAYCDLTLPEGWNNIYVCSSSMAEDSGSGSRTHEEAIAYFPQDLHLSQLKEGICLFLCSLDNSNLSDSSILCHVRRLDLDLETWRLGIPVDYRPKLSTTSDHSHFRPHMSHLQRRRCIHLQLEYQYLTTVIHTAVRRCGAAYATAEKLPDDLHSVCHSSSDLTLAASRATLQMFKSLENILEEDMFGHVAFYPPIAAWALFMNILIHPLDNRAQSDLDILASSITILQNIVTTDLTNDDIDCIGEWGGFMSELVRLGNSAIWKARRESRDIA